MESASEWVVAQSIHSLLQAPLYHYIVEGLLVVWIIRLLFFKSYKIHDKVPLTTKEKDELIEDWEPEPLVPPLEETRAVSKPYRVVSGQPGKEIVVDGYKCKNFASLNFLGFVENERISKAATECVSKYGVGSCGPRGFYGSFDVHLELEKRIAKFTGTECAIIYSYGFATIASAIPSYSKRGDILYVDEACCFAIQKGVQASRSNVVYFKHNDMEDLESKLRHQEMLDKKDVKKSSVTRKFMVVEGIYMNTGEICDLPRLVDLKYKYKVRLFVEESLSFGVLGQHGRGVTEHYNIPVEKVDMMCGSMEYSLASTGGFCCGREYVIDHQRLTGLGYVFSASLPPLLACAAIEAIDIMEEEHEVLFPKLKSKAVLLQQLVRKIPYIEVVGYLESPAFHIRRLKKVSFEEDLKFLNDIVNKSCELGVCLTVASRLKQIELKEDWPPSIRVSVSVNMSDDELQNMAQVLTQAVHYANEQA
uniref:serine palmitoyltransferase 1 isoform X1 n=1 Tax=Ciona intestinalis TaxID=7719 RepID=UPI0000524CF3|nr:serine palmitoyltransferase 1 isoform X1 [Ciona intestinalis]|eukprot:XP_002132110.1 serine palmitoyltransferase 1 isoform X1 [Ciona intestinalis]